MKLNPFAPLRSGIRDLLKIHKLPKSTVNTLVTLFGVAIVSIALMLTTAIVQAMTVYLVFYMLEHLP